MEVWWLGYADGKGWWDFHFNFPLHLHLTKTLTNNQHNQAPNLHTPHNPQTIPKPLLLHSNSFKKHKKLNPSLPQIVLSETGILFKEWHLVCRFVGLAKMSEM